MAYSLDQTIEMFSNAQYYIDPAGEMFRIHSVTQSGIAITHDEHNDRQVDINLNTVDLNDPLVSLFQLVKMN